MMGEQRIGPARAFALAERDLHATNQRLEVMHAEAWYPKQPDRDRPTPHCVAVQHPDHVAGSTWDCGLGDEQVRQGWARMIVHLHAAEQTSTDILCAAMDHHSRSVPKLRATSLLDAQSVVLRLRTRHRALQALWERWSGQEPTAGPAGNSPVSSIWIDQPRAAWLATQLMGPRGNPEGSCFEHIRQAMFETQRVVREVGTGKPPASCPKCRRIGSIGQPRKGGLCHACYQQKWRLERRPRQVKVRNTRRGAA